jgi:glycosyltransferase involved in cell wall biosynthesis
MTARPLVSIVTPSFQQAEFLDETIRSVLEQDYPNLEYLVVDGGSTDGSVEIIERHADRLAWWTSEPDGGQAAALNKGFARARGEILGWLCSDDVLVPGAIARVVHELERDPETLLVYGQAMFVDEAGRELHQLPARPFDVPKMVRNCSNYVVQPGSLFRRRAYELAGPLNEQGWYFFDFEFVLGLAGAGKVTPIQDRLALYRAHTRSKSVGAPVAKARDFLRFAEEFLPGSGLPGAERGRASAYLSAGEYFYEGLALPEARRALVKGLRLRPTRRGLGVLARALLPRPLVVRLRSRRRSGGAARG